MKRTIIFLLTALLLGAGALQGQTTIVRGGKPAGQIIIDGCDDTDRQAALLMQDFVERISGARIQVLTLGGQALPKKFPSKGSVIIGDRLNAGVSKEGLTEDGFRIVTRDGVVRIVSGGDKGAIYGVVTLLERCFGVNYWSENQYSLTRMATMTVPEGEIVENPAFRYRQSQNYALRTDPIYKMWLRLENPPEMFAGGYWVHTFDQLLPSAVYGTEHPEYYSFFNGQRHPGKASQWCLTNPDVLEIVSQRLDSIFRANPDRHLISVSQNDGNYTNCQCPDCKAIDDREEAISGSMVWFMNKLAERFPDKEVSMLAYLYTMKPPKHIKPLPNVNIMLCSIDCNREVTLTENESGREFMEALKGWSAITDNIFVWDYGINFDNYLVPFPNFHILGPNIRTFRDHGVNMHFSQIASSRGGDFAEMRTWLVSKLMWNPDADVDSLLHTFLNGYYGEAGPYLYQYVKVMEGALIGSGQRLWIYDSPVSHKHGMLKPELMRRYADLFDKAEAAVAGDSTLLSRVRRTRLPLQYSEIDIARTEPDTDMEEIARKLDLFEERARCYGNPALNERNNDALKYCDLYRKRYMPTGEKSLALGATVHYEVMPTGKYAALGGKALTDGLYGGGSFTESWVGWEGVDASFVVDLGETKDFNIIRTDFLHQLGQWILLPQQITYSLSSDGSDFTRVYVEDIPEDRDPSVKFVAFTYDSPEKLEARYIKVDVVGTKVCPHWHYGVGHPCWFFIDEVVVE